MKFEKKVILILLCTSFIYVLCAGGGLFLYIRAHPGALIPRWISVPILFLFILTIVIGSFLVRRAARKEARIETAEEGHLRRVRAIKGLKTGLIVWGVILLNDIRMLLQRTIPWKVAIPGSAIVLLMIAVTWVSLRRLQKAEAAGPETKQRQAL
jgi:Na+/H+ antiporter NhaD/arsenite permease-like protein